jgi:alpha-galactosidase
VKVFILAGDSNMDGRVQARLLKAHPARTKEYFQHLLDNGSYVVREDVWIKTLTRKGNLTVGFGQTPERFGPELELGHVVGNYFDEQVLLIKTCWGGNRLCAEFRPPSCGPAPENVVEEVRQQLRGEKPDATLADAEARCGGMYRDMLSEVRQTLANLGEHFPAYRGQGYEIAGFVWFSGWNDMVHPNYNYGYSAQLGTLIRDVRADFKTPHLPFVIGQMGAQGSGGMGKNDLDFRAQQAAVADLPEFAGNVKLVATDPFWDHEAFAVYKKGWQDHIDEWDRVGSDYPFHYLGSAKTICLIGRAFGEAMIELSRSGARN